MSDKVREYIQELDEGVKSLCESQRWKDWLNFLSVFHAYSPTNQLAIFLQKPDATMVASFTNWKKLNRIPRRGEKGIRIIAPHIYQLQREDGSTEERVGFHITHCFDVSQTYGDELPASPCNAVENEVVDAETVIDHLCRISPVPVSFEDTGTAANGFFNEIESKIVVKPTLSDSMKIRCLLHEITHSYVETSPDKPKDRHTSEVIAESVSYVCCKMMSLDTADYSFGYIANWSADHQLNEIKDSMDIISKTVNRIIGDMQKLASA